MTCDRVLKRLNVLLDAECPAEEAQQIRAHLDQCAACAAEYGQLAAVRRAADAWQVEGGAIWPALREQVEAPDLAAVLEEMRRLRAEIRSLRAEIALLRTQAAEKANPATRSPSPLLPYTPSATRELHIA